MIKKNKWHKNFGQHINFTLYSYGPLGLHWTKANNWLVWPKGKHNYTRAVCCGNKVRNSNQIDGLTSMELLGIICLIFFEVSVFFYKTFKKIFYQEIYKQNRGFPIILRSFLPSSDSTNSSTSHWVWGEN